jgi:predicted ATPase
MSASIGILWRSYITVHIMANMNSRAAQVYHRSQIRDSTIKNLLEKVAKRSYGKYLVRVKMLKLRSFQDVSVSFDFPVTALVGPNGGGKTTILGAAATAYDAVRPRQFFSKSGKFDESMLNWKVEYDLIDREVNKNDSFKRTATFSRQKWSRDAAKRDVAVFGVARTVPANERKELQRCATNTFSVDPARVESLQVPVITAVGRILGKDVSKYTHLRVDESGRVSLLAGVTDQGTAYSEFHFGAGESSIIRMVMKIESLSDNSLILVEEIENGLHPIATVRMVEYLIDVAQRKNAQAMFTTHSNDALAPLPPEAIWAAVSGHVYQGKLDIAALRAIAGQIDAQLAIFCEDTFAAAWLRAVLRADTHVAIEGVEIHEMLGDGTAVKINKNHNQDPSAKFPSACYIDGDSQQSESEEDRVIRLPGSSPEAYIFDRVLEREESLGGVLAVRLLQPHGSADKVLAKVKEIRRTNHDPHVIFSQIGFSLGLIPESTVRDAFLATWAEAFPQEIAEILKPIDKLLPYTAVESTQNT